MSTPTDLQSRLVPFAISTNGTTYYNVVCKKTWDLTGDKPLVEDDSDCGHHVAVGASTKYTIGFELIFNSTPDSDQKSSNDLMGYFDAGTLLYFKLQYPTSGSPGTTYYRQGTGYITQYKEQAPLNGFIISTGTLTMNGSIDLTP